MTSYVASFVAALCLTFLPVSKPCLCSGTLTFLCECHAEQAEPSKPSCEKTHTSDCCHCSHGDTPQSTDQEQPPHQPGCPNSDHGCLTALKHVTIDNAVDINFKSSVVPVDMPSAVLPLWWPTIGEFIVEREQLPHASYQQPPPFALVIAATQRLLI